MKSTQPLSGHCPKTATFLEAIEAVRPVMAPRTATCGPLKVALCHPKRPFEGWFRGQASRPVAPRRATFRGAGCPWMRATSMRPP